MKEIKTLKDIPNEELVVGGGPLCAGCPADLGLKLALKALGKNTVVINASGCMTLFETYPYMTMHVPWLHVAIENAGAAASGIGAALKTLKRPRANILCYVGDGAAYDIGFQSLSGACSRGDDFIFVCYNNSSFSNTGVQMSSATPRGAFTTTTAPGNPNWRKPLAKIIAAHGVPFSASANVAYPMDFIRKLQKASAVRGSKFIDLLAPCPTGWGFDHSQTVEVGKLATLTGVWPLYQVVNGKFELTFKVQKLLPVERFLETQRRFAHTPKETVKEIQSAIDREWTLLLQGKYWEAREY